MKQAFEKYSKSGFVCLPTKHDKSPNVKTSWNNGFASEYFNNAEGIGLICGKLSGGLECFDFDNHFGDAINVLTNFITNPEVKAIYEKYNLPIEKSQNGGYHLLFRCPKNEGNRKLAQRINGKNMPDAIIETRGQGGYFCAYPSKGYEVIKNDIFNVATITEIERAILIDNAISMNEFSPVVKMKYESGERPGDLYNSNINAIDEMKGILSIAGWKDLGSHKWRRPGKDVGISATLGKVAPNVFYVFTANAYPLEPMKAYTPFQVLGYPSDQLQGIDCWKN